MSETWCQSVGELGSKNEILHSCDDLADHLTAEAKQWAGPHLDQDCLVLHTPCRLFN